ncbi:MAG: hypothetical protein RL215_1139 [Planctomycetota bacterium]|jgi:hypothetical protein
MVQQTFTRQKHEMAKAVAFLEKIRAQEVRQVLRSPDGEVLEVTRDSYVDFPPEVIARQVLAIAEQIVVQHGARQQANSRNTGRFAWCGIEADLTVPQLRALQDVCGLLSDLSNRLPRRNPRMMANTTVDNRPACARKPVQNVRRETRYQPYEEDSTTRVRTYETHVEVLVSTTQQVEIDFGLEIEVLERLKGLVGDLRIAVQVAIDDANAKGHGNDVLLERVIAGIRAQLESALPAVGASESGE